jgi:alanyl-tRNA synthetase
MARRSRTFSDDPDYCAGSRISDERKRPDAVLVVLMVYGSERGLTHRECAGTHVTKIGEIEKDLAACLS